MRATSSVLLALGLAIATAACAADGAGAENIEVLDPHAAAPATITTFDFKEAFHAWQREPAVAGERSVDFVCSEVCTHPIELSVPALTKKEQEELHATPGDEEDTLQPYVVIGEPPEHENEVVVVAPRYSLDELVEWRSTDFGGTFSAARVVRNPSGKSFGTAVEQVVVDRSAHGLVSEDLADEGIAILSNNPSGGIALAGFESGTSMLSFSGQELQPVYGEAESGARPVIAFWRDEAGHPYELGYEHLKSAGLSLTSEASWQRATLGDGYAPLMTQAQSNAWLLSIDAPEGSAAGVQPTKLDLREHELAGSGFEPPVTIGSVPASTEDLFTYGGFGSNGSTTLFVTYPDFATGQIWLREVETAPVHVARERPIGSFTYPLDALVPERIAATYNFDGYTRGEVTFKDGRGDERLDLRGVPSIAETLSSGRERGTKLAVPTGAAVYARAHVFEPGTTPFGGYVGFDDPPIVVSELTDANGWTPAPGRRLPTTRPGRYTVAAGYAGDPFHDVAQPAAYDVLIVGRPERLGLSALGGCARNGRCRIYVHSSHGERLETVSLEVNGRKLRTYRVSRRGLLDIRLSLRRGRQHVELLAVGRGRRYFIQSANVDVRR